MLLDTEPAGSWEVQAQRDVGGMCTALFSPSLGIFLLANVRDLGWMNLTLPLVVVLMVSIRRLWGLGGKSSCKLCRQERKAGILLLLSIGEFSPPLAGRDLEAY